MRLGNKVITGRVLLLAPDSLVLVMFPGLISSSYRSHPSAGTQAHTTALAWDKLLVYNSDWPQISSIFLKASPFCLNFFSVCIGYVYSEDWSKVFHLLGKYSSKVTSQALNHRILKEVRTHQGGERYTVSLHTLYWVRLSTHSFICLLIYVWMRMCCIHVDVRG